MARRACELTRYRAFEPLDVLGLALAETGNFEDAINAAEQALALAEAANRQDSARQIRQRIARYRGAARGTKPIGP